MFYYRPILVWTNVYIVCLRYCMSIMKEMTVFFIYVHSGYNESAHRYAPCYGKPASAGRWIKGPKLSMDHNDVMPSLFLLRENFIFY